MRRGASGAGAVLPAARAAGRAAGRRAREGASRAEPSRACPGGADLEALPPPARAEPFGGRVVDAVPGLGAAGVPAPPGHPRPAEPPGARRGQPGRGRGRGGAARRAPPLLPAPPGAGAGRAPQPTMKSWQLIAGVGDALQVRRRQGSKELQRRGGGGGRGAGLCPRRRATRSPRLGRRGGGRGASRQVWRLSLHKPPSVTSQRECGEVGVCAGLRVGGGGRLERGAEPPRGEQPGAVGAARPRRAWVNCRHRRRGCASPSPHSYPRGTHGCGHGCWCARHGSVSVREYTNVCDAYRK